MKFSLYPQAIRYDIWCQYFQYGTKDSRIYYTVFYLKVKICFFCFPVSSNLCCAPLWGSQPRGCRTTAIKFNRRLLCRGLCWLIFGFARGKMKKENLVFGRAKHPIYLGRKQKIKSGGENKSFEELSEWKTLTHFSLNHDEICFCFLLKLSTKSSFLTLEVVVWLNTF